jgi:hypothetical protein
VTDRPRTVETAAGGAGSEVDRIRMARAVEEVIATTTVAVDRASFRPARSDLDVIEPGTKSSA